MIAKVIQLFFYMSMRILLLFKLWLIGSMSVFFVASFATHPIQDKTINIQTNTTLEIKLFSKAKSLHDFFRIAKEDSNINKKYSFVSSSKETKQINKSFYWISLILIIVFSLVSPAIILYYHDKKIQKKIKKIDEINNSLNNIILKYAKDVVIKQDNGTNDDILIYHEKTELKETSAISKLFAKAMNEKDPSKALFLFDIIIELNPNNYEVFYNRGNLKSDMGDKSGAMADYNTAIALNPFYVDAYNNRGILKYQMGDYHGALSDYDKAISLNPDDIKAINNRANLKFDMADYDSALSDYDKAISLNTDDANAYKGRAYSFRKLAESKQDPAKKEDLIAKAESDEKKAESLKKDGKA